MVTLDVINPAHGGIIKHLECDTAASVGAKYARMVAAQSAWASRTLVERKACIQRFGDLLMAERDRLAAITTSETGKPGAQARSEITATVERVAYFVEHASRVWAPELVHTSDDGTLVERITYEPLGVVGNISAWNYPYFVGANVFIPALLAGNAVLYKPSEYATLTGLAMAELLHRAGVPNTVFTTAIGGGDVGAALLEQPLGGVFFTGSYATGRKIAQAAANQLVKVQLELGGKDPAYVSDDVDIGRAAAAVCDGAFYNAGQSCCAVERIYVHQRVYPAFVEAFLACADALVMGDPTDPATTLGPLTRDAARASLLQQVADATQKGATLRRGGHAVPGPGYFFEPTVLTEVHHGMAVMVEESFGPIIGIMAVQDDAVAVERMNDTLYGLTASVFCNSASRTEAMLRQLRCGTVYANCCDRVSARLPWTGRRHSGLGVTLSEAGMRAVVQPKAWHQKNWSHGGSHDA